MGAKAVESEIGSSGGRRRWWTRSRVIWLASAGVGALAFLLMLVVARLDDFYGSHALEAFANYQYDVALNDSLPQMPGIRDPHIILVAITDDTPNELIRRHFPPKSRGTDAMAVRQLTRLGAKVIALDLVYHDDPSNPEAQRQTDELIAAMRAHGRVVAGGNIRWEKPTDKLDWLRQNDYPMADIRDVAATGWVNLPLDVDGAVRRFEWYNIGRSDAGDDEKQPALAAAACALYLNQAAVREVQAVDQHRFCGRRIDAQAGTSGSTQRGEERPPTGPTSYISYAGSQGSSFRQFFYEDILEAERLQREGRSDFDAVRGALVIVGDFSRLSQDWHKTPVVDPRTRKNEMPGPEIQANAAHTILAGNYIHTGSLRAQLWFMFLAAMITALVTRRLSPLPGILAAAAVCWGTLAVGEAGLVIGRIWLDPVRPFFTVILAYAGEMVLLQTTERRQQREIRRTFGRIASPQVMERLLRDDEPPPLGGELREVTLLFSDLQGFTSMSEQLAATEVVRLLNDYLQEMIRTIDQHGGTVDKIMGDGIMAYFGAPRPQPDHARDAVACALEMQAALERFRQERRAQGLAPLFMRIGIHTGEAVVGLIGAQERSEYTIIGDVVNVAARLEAMNKEFGTTILLSEATCRAAQPAEPATFRGEVTVRGRRDAIGVYSIGPMQPAKGG